MLGEIHQCGGLPGGSVEEINSSLEERSLREHQGSRKSQIGGSHRVSIVTSLRIRHFTLERVLLTYQVMSAPFC